MIALKIILTSSKEGLDDRDLPNRPYLKDLGAKMRRFSLVPKGDEEFVKATSA